MSTAAAQALVRGVRNTRQVPRFPLAVPADVIVLRSGIPCSIPGRSVSIGEHGLGVVLAGEVHPGDSVAIELRLPGAGGRVRLSAVVRYQALLRCGFEFLNLTAEQRTLIEQWTEKRSAPSSGTALPVSNPQTTSPLRMAMAVPLGGTMPDRKSHGTRFRALWIVLAGALLLGGLGWWRWYRAWNELESQIPVNQPLPQPPPTTVPAEVMEALVTHKVEPIYPEAARQANIQGVVVLDVVIASDGTVADVRPISGPDELTSAAVDAVKWWRFQPYLANGQPAPVKTTLAVDFQGN